MSVLESLTKNEIVNDYTMKQVSPKTRDDRTVNGILDVMEEKYSHTKGEKILDLMKSISGFKMDDRIEDLARCELGKKYYEIQ